MGGLISKSAGFYSDSFVDSGTECLKLPFCF